MGPAPMANWMVKMRTVISASEFPVHSSPTTILIYYMHITQFRLSMLSGLTNDRKPLWKQKIAHTCTELLMIRQQTVLNFTFHSNKPFLDESCAVKQKTFFFFTRGFHGIFIQVEFLFFRPIFLPISISCAFSGTTERTKLITEKGQALKSAAFIVWCNSAIKWSWHLGNSSPSYFFTQRKKLKT